MPYSHFPVYKKKMLHHMTVSYSLSWSKESVSICIKVCSFYYLSGLHRVYRAVWGCRCKEWIISKVYTAKQTDSLLLWEWKYQMFAAGKWICSEAFPWACFDRCLLMDICTKVSGMPYFIPSVSWHITFLYLLCFQ